MVRFSQHVIGILIGLFLVTGTQAQSNTTGFIRGEAETPSGEPVGGAFVTLIDEQSGVRRTSRARPDGRFRFAALPVGTYGVIVTAPGRSATERHGVRVAIGTGTKLHVVLAPDEQPANLEPVQVEGGRISLLDVTLVESASIISDQTINRLPVSRDVDSVALLAPGTTRSPVFDRVGFGGASVAENSYYVNGMNLTNFRNGLGASTVPFEFYRQFEIKTGGYGVEFGRSTGGVVNAVTKRGGDVFAFGVGTYWEPDWLRNDAPDVISRNPGLFDYVTYHSADKSRFLDAHAYASGPAVRDHLFFYALIERTEMDEYSESGPSSSFGWPVVTSDTAKGGNTFWGTKVDWQLNPYHLIEFTAFSDQRDSRDDYREIFPPSGELRLLGDTTSFRGGTNYILRYAGYFGQSLTLSALAGRSAYDRTDRSPQDDIPVTIDDRAAAPTPFPTDWINFQVGRSSDRRRTLRLDGELSLVAHLVRFGLDHEKNTTDDLTTLSGGIYWRYFDAMPGEGIPGGVVPEGATQITRERVVNTGGGYEVNNTALYLEDHWLVGDDLTLYAGIRRETFRNENAVGDTFIEMNDQWARRLGFSWDVQGRGLGKLYGTAGRYLLPIPTSVNMGLSGALLVTDDWYVLEGLNPDGTPIKGEKLSEIVTYDGSVPDTTQLIDTDLDPTYQDEFILGYVHQIAGQWSMGVRGIYRDLKNVIEDVSFGRLLNAYAAEHGYEDFLTLPFATYVLTNPGTDANLRFDLDYDGTYEQVYFSAAEIGLPHVRRTYKALEIYFERRWDEHWSLQGSYTYSRTRGNYEGWTDSFTGEVDGPLMSAFDLPEIMQGADGKLPSDRPHTVKLFGSWSFGDHWELAGNFLFHSGVPYGARGCHPDLGPFYGCQFFYDGAQLVPRGSRGRSGDVFRLDVGLQFRWPSGYRNGLFRARVDVMNVLNAHTATSLRENVVTQEGATDLDYGLPLGFQQPRSVRLSARFDF